MTHTTCTCDGTCQTSGEPSEQRGSGVADVGAAFSSMAVRTVSRRGVITGSVAVVAGFALAGCSSDDTGATTTPTPATTSPSASESASATESATADGYAASGEKLTTTGGIAVGGGTILTASVGTVVVTHPADGQFKAFNGKCPHQGCPVSAVADNTITCNCHGSTFDAETGDRTGGPTPTGLTPLDITVSGDAVYLT